MGSIPLTTDWTTDWTAQITSASTEEQVLDAARNFLESRSPRFLSELPGHCQPPVMQSAQDVSSYAYILTHLCIVKEDVYGELLETMRFFGAASQRLSIIVTPRGYTPRPFTQRPPTQ